MADDKYAQLKSYEALNARGLTAKREYVRGLEQRSDAEALSLLVECLCDDSWYLRDLAEEAFMRLADRGAPLLLPLLDQGLWFTRTSAARVLGRLGYRNAVPALLRLADDANATVGAAAQESLAAIGNQRGAVAIAHALHRAAPDLRGRRLDELSRRDTALAERVGRLMRQEELMTFDSPEPLSDDHALVRSSEEGVEWELLTGPSQTHPRADEAGGGDGGKRA